MELNQQRTKLKAEVARNAFDDTKVVWEFNKNTRGEIIRIDLHTWKGRPLVSIRTWYRGEDGEMRPGREGFTIGIEKLAELRTGLDKAREEGTLRGWL